MAQDRLHRRSRRLTGGPPMVVALWALPVAGVLLGACGGSGSTASPPPSPPPTRAPSTTTSVPPPVVATPSTTINGRSYTVPTDTAGTPIDPLVATGQQIILTPRGFLPYRLFASVHEPITWTNLTPSPVRIRFEYSSVTSPLVAPGGTFTYSSTTGYDVAYRSSSGFRGILAIGAFP